MVRKIVENAHGDVVHTLQPLLAPLPQEIVHGDASAKNLHQSGLKLPFFHFGELAALEVNIENVDGDIIYRRAAGEYLRGMDVYVHRMHHARDLAQKALLVFRDYRQQRELPGPIILHLNGRRPVLTVRT